MQNTFLTPHFSLLEMCESRTANRYGIVNVAPPDAVENLKRLNEILAHSARKSQRLTGCAADFYVGQGRVSRSRFQVSGHRERLIKAFRLILTELGIDFDQLIIYPTFIHVSYVSPQANRHYIMTANGSGQYQRILREQALMLS